MKAATQIQRTPGIDEITHWLVAELSRRLRIDPKEIDVTYEIAGYGLDSRQAIRITASLEDWLGRKLSPTLLWEYPTVSELAEFLSQPESDEGCGN